MSFQTNHSSHGFSRLSMSGSAAGKNGSHFIRLSAKERDENNAIGVH
jgi:hypothetical protein